MDKESGKSVFVDSFDNTEFDVRVGTMTVSKFVGTIHAESDKLLNTKLQRLVQEVA